MMNRNSLTLTATGAMFNVHRGVTFLALIDFGGPRNTIRTHDGHLYADETKAVYALRMAARQDADFTFLKG